MAFAATVVWCVVQIATWIPTDYQHPIWSMAREALELNVLGSISVNRDATMVALLRLLTAGSVFWLALQLGRSERQAKLIIQAVALIGLAYALYGLTAFFMFPQTLLWLGKIYYLDALTSTFVNRNSYATYAAMGLLASLGLALSALRTDTGVGSAARQGAWFVARLTGMAGIWLGATAVIAIALVLTASRGGIGAAFLGLAVGITLSVLHRRHRRSVVVVSAALVLLAVMAMAIAFGDLLAVRLVKQGLQSDDRLAVYVMTVTSIGDRPLLGFGYGTFEHVFPMYRDGSIGPFPKWDKAHNTYLEVIQGLGIPVAALFLSGIGFLVWRCFLGALRRRRFSTAPLVASAVSATVIAHAFVDFSLQIQGIALTWVALLGVGVAQSWSSAVQASSPLRRIAPDAQPHSPRI